MVFEEFQCVRCWKYIHRELKHQQPIEAIVSYLKGRHINEFNFRIMHNCQNGGFGITQFIGVSEIPREGSELVEEK